MPVTLTNRSRALVTLELNTGRWIHLSPGESSRTLEDYQVRNNRHLDKLVHRRTLDVFAVPAPSEGAPQGARKAGRARKR